MMTIALSVLGTTLAVASPNVSYMHSAARQPERVQTVSRAEPEVRRMGLNGMNQYLRPISWNDKAPATNAPAARTFLSVGK